MGTPGAARDPGSHQQHTTTSLLTPAPGAVACSLTAVAVTLEEITGQNREAVLALRVAPGQERFVSSVEDSLAAAAGCPEAVVPGEVIVRLGLASG